jgi:hypothetical protein
MEGLASTIANNEVLQAVGIVAAVGTALGFVWNNRTVLIRLLLFVPRKFDALITPSPQETRLAIRVGALNAAYLVAYVSRHFSVALLSCILWLISVRVTDTIKQTSTGSEMGTVLWWSFAILNNVLCAIVAARLLEVFNVSRSVIRLIEDIELQAEPISGRGE